MRVIHQLMSSSTIFRNNIIYNKWDINYLQKWGYLDNITIWAVIANLFHGLQSLIPSPMKKKQPKLFFHSFCFSETKNFPYTVKRQISAHNFPVQLFRCETYCLKRNRTAYMICTTSTAWIRSWNLKPEKISCLHSKLRHGRDERFLAQKQEKTAGHTTPQRKI